MSADTHTPVVTPSISYHDRFRAQFHAEVSSEETNVDRIVRLMAGMQHVLNHAMSIVGLSHRNAHEMLWEERQGKFVASLKLTKWQITVSALMVAAMFVKLFATATVLVPRLGPVANTLMPPSTPRPPAEAVTPIPGTNNVFIDPWGNQVTQAEAVARALTPEQHTELLNKLKTLGDMADTFYKLLEAIKSLVDANARAEQAEQEGLKQQIERKLADLDKLYHDMRGQQQSALQLMREIENSAAQTKSSINSAR